VDAVAQGRVWSGVDAHELGLVDHLGDLDDAIAAAAELAELGDDYAVAYIEKEEEFKDKILREFMAEVTDETKLPNPSPFAEVLGRVEAAAGELAAFNDPNHVYAWSNIETD
jgi:protease-4